MTISFARHQFPPSIIRHAVGSICVSRSAIATSKTFDEGEVLELLVQRRRDKASAVKLMRKRDRHDRWRPEARTLKQGENGMPFVNIRIVREVIASDPEAKKANIAETQSASVETPGAIEADQVL
jgi:hypothetical protein